MYQPASSRRVMSYGIGEVMRVLIVSRMMHNSCQTSSLTSRFSLFMKTGILSEQSRSKNLGFKLKVLLWCPWSFLWFHDFPCGSCWDCSEPSFPSPQSSKPRKNKASWGKMLSLVFFGWLSSPQMNIPSTTADNTALDWVTYIKLSKWRLDFYHSHKR